MNLSESNQYIKFPYIKTLKKYWLEYDNGRGYPDYMEILSENQIKELYKILKENTLMEDYVSGKKWGENIIEKKYISEFVKEQSDEDNKLEDIQEKDIKEIFNNLYNKDNHNNIIYENKRDLPLYRLFYNFANMKWIRECNNQKPNSEQLPNSQGNYTKLIISPYFYDPNFKYNDSWKYQLANTTPCNIHLLVEKELNFLLMEQDLNKFRKEESCLDSSKQLEYMKSKNNGEPIQEIFSYINHVDISKYGDEKYLFDPKPYTPKVVSNFKPTIPYNKNMYGISSSNLLTLQIVESLSYKNNSYIPRSNLSNTDILMNIREKNNIIGKSSKQINTYSTPSDNVQIPYLDGEIKNVNPRLYKKISLKRVYH